MKITFVITIFFLCSCGVRDTGDQADIKLNELLSCIKGKNKESLKHLFTKQVIEETEDLDNGIEYVFELLTDTNITWKRDKHQVSKQFIQGNSIIEIKAWYEIHSPKQDFILFMIYYPTWRVDHKKEGIYALRVVKVEDQELQLDNWQKMKNPGIYIP